MKTKQGLSLLLTFSMGFLFFSPEIHSCTIIAVGKKASADGSVIISHTDCGEDSRIRVVHGQTFPEGAMAPVHWGIQEIHRPLDDHAIASVIFEKKEQSREP